MTVTIRPIRPSDYRPVIAVGFMSQSRPAEAYIHFVGVHPDERGHGLGRRLYEHFEPGDAEASGVPVTAGYGGDGQDRVRFVKSLAA